MDIISDTAVHILSLLARFKFVCISQMLPLLGKSMGYIRQQLTGLAAKGYIKSFQLSKTFKTEAMYYLTESGKELILQHSKVFDSDIKLPIGVPLLVKDYAHRKNMISVTIALYYQVIALGITVTEFLSYFDKQGDNRKSANLEARTKIPIGNGFFIPDGIMLTEKDEQKTIYLIEMYCDASSTRVLEQLNKHILAIAQGSPAVKLGIEANPFVLSCFEHDGIKKKVIEKLSENQGFAPFAHLFFFATLREIQQDGSAFKDIHNNSIVFI